MRPRRPRRARRRNFARVHERGAMSKTILITGASRGIGRAAAVLAGERRWAVGVNFVGQEPAAKDAVAEVERAGGRALAIRGDVSAEADVLAMFDAVEKGLGP